MAGFNPVFDPTGQGPFDWVGDGQEKYENGRRYVMQGGQWVDYGPATPPVEPIDNNVAPWGFGPKPETGGETKVIGGVTYKKVNGDWVAQPSTGATGGLFGQIGDETDRIGGTNMAQNPLVTVFDPQYRDIENKQGAFTAYLQAMGLGGRSYLNPAERYTASLASPLSTLQGLQGRMGRLKGFEQYAPESAYLAPYAQAVGGGSGIYQRAQTLLAGILGMNPEQRVATETSYGEGDDLKELQEILQWAGREKYGTQGSEFMARRVAAEQQPWLNYQAGGGTNPFLDYLKMKYNLG